MYIDDTLIWNTHLKQMSFHLTKLAGLFYRLHNYVNKQIICMLYHSLIKGYNMESLYGEQLTINN